MAPASLLRRCASGALVTAVALASPAYAAPSPVPAPDGRVDDDPARDAGRPDITAGTTTPGAPATPWAAFEKKAVAGRKIFVRALLDGRWQTQGAALNTLPASVAEGPAIDFAGPGRTIPWASWYEAHSAFAGTKQVFAARLARDVWTPSGQARVSGPAVPSLNLNPLRNAENPAIAGGAVVPGADPEPWVAWQEISDNAKQANQIFVSRAVKQVSDTVRCTGFTPATGDLTAVGGFCWQQVGTKRLPTFGAPHPSLNVDLNRDAVEPDIAFAGPSGTVPWVVWHEEGSPSTGLATNTVVFAAKAVPAPAADGGFQWVVHGRGGAGVLDGSGPRSTGPCGASLPALQACSLNADPARDARNVRIAAGTQNPAEPTVPWVVWQEEVGGTQQVFVARLVGDRFELFNGGRPVSDTAHDATRPDITFAGNVPYITWVETIGAQHRGFVGHFENTSFVLDTPGGFIRESAGLVPDSRVPITSTCTATPFNADGSACQGGATGSPAYLFLEASPTIGIPTKLFADGFSPVSATTGPATNVGSRSADVTATVNGGGAPVTAVVEFGTTTAYGSRSAPVRVQPGQPGTVTVELDGLPAGTTIHYRVVGLGDFGSVAGADATFQTAAVTPAPPGTRITKAPKRKVVTRSKKAKVRFRFTSDVAGSRFVCRVRPSARFQPCASPKTFRLRPGRYRFAVRAIAPDAQADPTPATKRFRVVRRR